jgi:hypothetical protein
MDKRGAATSAANHFVTGSDGRPIHPPTDERTNDTIKKMSTLASNMESIALNFK